MTLPFTYLRKIDWILIGCTLLLLAVSLITLFSVAQAQETPDFSTFTKQLIVVGVGLLLLFGVSMVNYQVFQTFGYFFYGLGLVFLLAVLFFGTEIRGTQGWFFLFSDLGIQPVEFAKLALIIVLAKVFAQWDGLQHPLKPVIVGAGLTAVYIFLVLFQPDFGSALILLITFLGMLFLTNIKKRTIFLVLVGLVILGTLGALFFLQDFQKERILTFLEPSRDPYGSGYNLQQSIIAIGSGQIFGRGLGLGSQSRLNFLPSQQTDFIFAVIAEAFGLIGVLLILILFGVLAFRVVRAARFGRDDFGVYVTSGFLIMILSQTIINIGGNLGLLPITGLPLPFVSAGGSSLLVSLIGLGIVQSVFSRRVSIHPTV